MKRSFLLYAFIILVLMNVFLPTYSSEVAFEQNRYDKQLKIKRKFELLLLNWMMPIIFFGKKKSTELFWLWDSEKMIKYEKLIPYVTEKLLDLIQTQREPLRWSRSNRG
jgi:hypothetical protein